MTAGRETGGLSAEDLAAILHRAFHDQWGGPDPTEPLDLYPTSAIWEAQARAILATRAAQPDAGTALDEVERRIRQRVWPNGGARVLALDCVEQVRAAHGQDESGEGECPGNTTCRGTCDQHSPLRPEHRATPPGAPS